MPEDHAEQEIMHHDLDELTRQFRECRTSREACSREVNVLSQRLARIEGMWTLLWTVLSAMIAQGAMLIFGGGR